MPKFLISIFYLICLLGSNGLAQIQIDPEGLTIKDGLSQGYITVIHQDEEGYMWFGTKNGLNRYDGREFEVFKHDPDNPYAIANDWAVCILEEGDFLLIGTKSQDLNLFHKRTKKFFKLSLKREDIENFEEITHILKDANGHFWISTRNSSQLIRLQFPKYFWTRFPKDNSLLDSIAVVALAEGYGYQDRVDEANIIITNNKISKKLNLEELKIHPLATTSPYVQIPEFKMISPTLGIGLLNQKPQNLPPCQLYRYRAKKWEQINSAISFNWYYYYDIASNLIWVHNSEQDQLFAFDPDVIENTERLIAQEASYEIKDSTSIQTFFKDRSGILWMGTTGLGLKKLSPRRAVIKTYLQNESVYGQLFSTSDNEVLYHNIFGEVFYRPGETATLKAINALIEIKKPQKIYWLNDGWFAMTTAVNDQNDVSFLLYQHQDGVLTERARLPIQYDWLISELSLIKARDQKLYATYSNNFIQYDPNTQTHQLFELNLLKEKDPSIFYIVQTADSDFWIGTSQGLIRAKAKGNRFEFQLVEEGLRNKICASLLVDPNDGHVLWIGTKGGGLHRLDTRTMQFQYVNEKNGLPNDVIYAVLNDEQGNLWLSSNKGIIRYNPETGAIRNFTDADGMQSDEFNTYAFGKSPNGALLFGGIKGLNVFHPNDLRDNFNVPSVQIKRLKVNNQTISPLDSTGILEESMEYTKEVKLAYHQNNFTLTFAALEFTAPIKNQFNYYLEGAEQEWVHTSEDNEATYLNLNPGKYTFKLKASNGDGIWNEEIKELEITILPPWYRSNLAYSVYLLLTTLGIWQFWRFQKRRIELRHAVELEQQRSERLKELDEAKTRLYTNITHEFRTPLTVISGIVAQLDEANEIKAPVLRNTDQLLNLVNQLLDLRKLESGNMTLHYTQSDLIRYIRYLTESFQSYAKSLGITFHFLSKKESFIMDFDKDKITRIVSNLLSNAIKFTPEGGNVYIQTVVQENQFIFEIKDTGIGIPAQELAHIFNQFYQVDETSTRKGEGTGIGLTLVKELLTAMQGEISVSSLEGKGATFTVSLPIKNEAPIDQEDYEFQAALMPPTIINLEESELRQAELNAEKDKPTILIIEDNIDVIHFLIKCLQKDFQLDIAMDGEEGIYKAIENIPDFIISDVMMPKKNGFEVCETLKMDEHTSHIPIILLTAKADIESKLEGLEHGADTYLVKPFHQKELLLHIQNFLTLRQKMQSKHANLSLSKTLLREASTQTADLEDAFLQKIRRIIEKDLSNGDIGMPQLIRKIGMSRSQVYKKVKALTGKSPSQYIRSIRLAHAQKMLQESDLNISEIGYEVGFSSPNYFSQVFFDEFGCRPNEIRK